MGSVAAFICIIPYEIEVALPEAISGDRWDHTAYYLNLILHLATTKSVHIMVTLDRADEPPRYHDHTEGGSGGQVHQARRGLPGGALLHPLLH